MIITLLFVLGLTFGSFINAVVWRLRQRRNFVSERSECEHCHHELSAWDLVPVVSWLLLGGYCRYCKKRISALHPAVELATGILFALSYVWWPTSLATTTQQISFAIWLLVTVGTVGLFIYDLRWKLLPDKIVFPLMLLATVEVVNRATIGQGGLATIADSLVGVVVLSGFFGVLYAISGGKWIGLGDVKLGVVMGLLLGAQNSILALMSSYYLGALVVVPLLLLKRVGPRSHIPFGPFLLAAFWLSYFFGSQIIHWYQGRLG